MTPSEIVPKAELAKATREVATTTAPVLNTASTLVIIDQPSYEGADEVLKRIRQARRSIETRLGVIIDPIYGALQSLYKLRKELDSPLELAEGQLKEKMKQFQIKEQRRIADERAAKEAELEKARLAAAKAQELADKASRANVKTVLNKKAEAAIERVIEVESKPIVEAPRATGSSVRKTRKPKIVNMLELVQAVGAGQVPLDILVVDWVALRNYSRDELEIVGSWPGVEIVEEVSIVGR